MQAGFVEVSVHNRDDVHMVAVQVEAQVGPFAGQSSSFLGIDFDSGVSSDLLEFADSIEAFPLPAGGSVPLEGLMPGEPPYPTAFSVQAFAAEDIREVYLDITLRSERYQTPLQEASGELSVRFWTDYASLQRWASDLRKVGNGELNVARIEDTDAASR